MPDRGAYDLSAGSWLGIHYTIRSGIYWTSSQDHLNIRRRPRATCTPMIGRLRWSWRSLLQRFRFSLRYSPDRPANQQSGSFSARRQSAGGRARRLLWTSERSSSGVSHGVSRWIIQHQPGNPWFSA